MGEQNTPIRIQTLWYVGDMPEGEYSRSEGSTVSCRVTYVHPEDARLLLDSYQQRAAVFAAARAAGLTRRHWEDWTSIEWAGEEGDPLADKYLAFEEAWREENFITPEFIEVEECDPSTWSQLQGDEVVKRSKK
ncbi:MAG: hypothetical protein AB1453_14710 [Chloroflexota bacterium]|jgi:hypothetical protein